MCAKQCAKPLFHSPDRSASLLDGVLPGEDCLMVSCQEHLAMKSNNNRQQVVSMRSACGYLDG